MNRTTDWNPPVRRPLPAGEGVSAARLAPRGIEGDEMEWAQTLGWEPSERGEEWECVAGGRDRLRALTRLAVGYNALLATGLVVLPLGAVTAAGLAAFFVAGNLALAHRLGPVLD